eukprot:gene11419-biopygen18390
MIYAPPPPRWACRLQRRTAAPIPARSHFGEVTFPLPPAANSSTRTLLRQTGPRSFQRCTHAAGEKTWLKVQRVSAGLDDRAGPVGPAGPAVPVGLADLTRVTRVVHWATS